MKMFSSVAIARVLSFPHARFSKAMGALLLSGLLAATPAAVQATVFAGGPITFNDGATSFFPGTPYPSTILVSGLLPQISSITLTLTNFTRSGRPDDVDILLVGPTGASLIVFSDVGGNGGATGTLTFTLSDLAGSFLPDGGPLVSGTFKPTNESTNETGPANFPAPAPAGAYGNPGGVTVGAGPNTFASQFNGTNPNGTWSLYIVDDTGGSGGETGSITGWSLDIVAVPEPSTWALLIAGVAALAFFARRQRVR
jgi:hypothetical protein